MKIGLGFQRFLDAFGGGEADLYEGIIPTLDALLAREPIKIAVVVTSATAAAAGTLNEFVLLEKGLYQWWGFAGHNGIAGKVATITLGVTDPSDGRFIEDGVVLGNGVVSGHFPTRVAYLRVGYKLRIRTETTYGAGEVVNFGYTLLKY